MNVHHLALCGATTVVQFAYVVARSVDYATDMTRMLKNNVVELNHHLKLSQRSTL